MTEQKRQIDIIADILEREGKIDNFRCIHERISLRLGARIRRFEGGGISVPHGAIGKQELRLPPGRDAEAAAAHLGMTAKKRPAIKWVKCWIDRRETPRRPVRRYR
jgi:hypothetical protein